MVINITICGDWAGPAYDNGGFPGTCADAVADPSNYDSTTFSPLYANAAYSKFPHRSFDQDKQYLRLPEMLGFFFVTQSR